MIFTSFKSLSAKLTLLIAILITSMVFFEGGAVSVAIPHIQEQFKANLSQIQWVANAYVMMLAVLTLITGSLGDRFGRKKVILVGLVFFALGGGLSAVSTDIKILIASRFVQGIGGAILIPQSLAILTARYAKSIQGQAIGIWSSISGAVLVFGAVLAGWIIQYLGWPYIFWLLIPISFLTGIAAWIVLPDVPERFGQKLDWIGLGLLSGGLLGTFFAIIQIPVLGWGNPQIIFSAILGIIFMVSFWRWEARVIQPLIDFKILVERNIVLANVFTLLLYTASNGLIFFISMYLQRVLDLNPLQTGLAILPMLVAVAVLTAWSGSWADRWSPKYILMIGAGLVTAGLLWLLSSGITFNYWLNIAPGLILFGAGFGLFIPSLSKVALAVQPEFSGAASGLNNSVSTIAGLVGVSVLSLLVSGVFTHSLRSTLPAVDIPAPVREYVIREADRLLEIELPSELSPTQRDALQAVTNESFVAAYRWQLVAAAGLALSGVLAAALLREKQPED